MNLYKLGAKIFVTNPAAVPLREFIPVFHHWIQQQKIAGHLLLDVHDYSHVHQGPGILLVAHEGNFSLDQAGGRLGLLYYRKQPLAGGVEACLPTVVKTALQACALLEAEPKLNGIRFATDELMILANDRLLAPNTPETGTQLEPLVAQCVARWYVAPVKVTPQSGDPRERFALTVKAPTAPDLRTLLGRVS